jgi:NAD(P)-dependent dehydrogenase (short-subunit alcohol dehydrogenase family)
VGLVGAAVYAKHFIPLVVRDGIYVNISARVGSIGDNILGGWHSYRITKAGLNQLTRTLAAEMKGIKVVAIHPGFV